MCNGQSVIAEISGIEGFGLCQTWGFNVLNAQNTSSKDFFGTYDLTAKIP
jgi:hypothetical protein